MQRFFLGMVVCRTTLTTIEKSCEDDEVQIVWAKAGCGIWGLGHVFQGKLYFTKAIVDDNFVPRNRKPKRIPKPEVKPAPKPASVLLGLEATVPVWLKGT